MIIVGMVLRHLSDTDPEPVNIDGMEFREKLEDGSPFPYPVQANFDQSRHIGFAHVFRGVQGNLYAECHINTARLSPEHTHLAAGLSFVKAARTNMRVHHSKLLAIGTTDSNVDPSIPPFTVINRG